MPSAISKTIAIAIASAVREKLSSSPNERLPASRMSVINMGGRYRLSALKNLTYEGVPDDGLTGGAALTALLIWVPQCDGSGPAPGLKSSEHGRTANGSRRDPHPWICRLRNAGAVDFV